MAGEEHECLYHEEPPRTKQTLLLCLCGLVTVAVHKKIIPWGLRGTQFVVWCAKAVVGAGAAWLRRLSRRVATKKEDDQHRGTATKTTITSVTIQSVSFRCRVRGVEIGLSDGVIVRIGSLSFWPPESLPLLLLLILLLIPGTMRLRLRLLLLGALLFLLLSFFLLRRLWWKGKGRAFAVSLQDVRVSLPGRPSATKAASESAASGHSEKAATLPGMVLLCVYLIAIEVRGLRVEIAAAQEATKRGGSDHHEGPLDESIPEDAADSSGATAAAGRAIELTGLRLTGHVSASRLTVSSLFQEVTLLEYGDRAEVSGLKGDRQPSRSSTKRATSSLPSRLSGGGDVGGGGGAVPKASVALESVHIAITIGCSRPAAKGHLTTMQWLCSSCTLKLLQLEGLRSLAVTVGRADAAADLSWVEGQLATKEQGRDTQGEVGLSKSPLQVRGAEGSRNVDSCESPCDGTATGSAVTMDARLVPECAELCVGAFALVCRDDRVNNDIDSDHNLKPHVSLGELEISSDASNGVLGWDLDNTKPSFIPANATAAGVKHCSLAVSWSTLSATAGEQSSVPASPGLGLANFRKFFSRQSVRDMTPAGARASLRLGEVRIKCHPLEAGAKRGAEKTPTSSSSVVVENISAVPRIIEVQPRQAGERNPPIKQEESRKAQQPIDQPARGTLAGVRGAAREPTIRDSTGDNNSGCTTDGGLTDNVRPPNPRQSPPPLPPRPPPPPPLPSTRLQGFQMPEVKVHASTITGKVDAGLAGWLNLRGLREAEFLAAKGRRMVKLVAAGVVPPTGNCGPRKCMSIDKVRVSVEEALGGGTSDAQRCKGGGEGPPGRKGRCRGLFEFEADDVSGQQEKIRHGDKGHLPASCDKLFRAMGGSHLDSFVAVQDTCMSFKCSRASVTLADKLPLVSEARVPTAPQRQGASAPPCFSPPSAGGDKSSGTISIEGAAEGSFSDGDSERVAKGVVEDIPQDGEQGQDDNGAAAMWNRVKLALGEVCIEKVVEKDALGATVKGAMAVSCREVSGSESVGHDFCEQIVSMQGLSFAQVRFPGIPATIPGDPCHSTATATVPESQPGTKEASQGAFCNTNVTGGIGDHPKDGSAPATTPVEGAGAVSASPARKGSVKAEDIAIDQTDMTWSGSVHCMLIRLSQRLVLTIDHLVGLPAPPPPVEFTRRVLLRRAFLRCALSEVTKKSHLSQASRTVPQSPSYSAPLTTGCRSSPHRVLEGRNVAPEDGQAACDSSEENEPTLCPPSSPSSPSSPSLTPWCHHRADVRLTNFKMRIKKKKVVPDANLSGDEARQQPIPPSLRAGAGGGKEEGEKHHIPSSLPSLHSSNNEESSFCTSDSRKEGDDATTTGLSGSPSAGGSNSDLNRLSRKTCSSPVGGDGVGGEWGEGWARRKDGTASPEYQGQELENDAEMTIGADLLEILVPSPSPLPRPPSPVNPNGSSSHDFGPSDAPRRDGVAGKNPHKDSFLDGIQLDREALLPIPAVAVSATVSRTLGTAVTHNSSRGQRRNTWSGMTGKVGSGGGGGGDDRGSNVRPVEGDSRPQGSTEEIRRNETEEEQRANSGHAGGSGFEADCVEGNDEDGYNLPMTRLIAIDSFRFQRSVEWHLPAQKQQHHEQPSPPEAAAKRKPTSHGSDLGDEHINQGRTTDSSKKCPREKDGNAGVDVAGITACRVGEETAETNADGEGKGGERSSICRRQPRLWSQMGIEIRAGHIVASLPPRFQLGDLQVTALLQWKGIQEALDESSPSLPADACTTSVLLGGFTLHLDGDMPPQSPPPLHPKPLSPASSPSPSPPRSLSQQLAASRPDDSVDGSEGRDGVASFFSGLQHLSRGGGSASGGWGGGWGSSSVGGGRGSHGMPWQQHPRALLKGLRHGRASLSSFLGFSGSPSDLNDIGAEGVDRASACSRRTSGSPAATDGVSGEENPYGKKITEAVSGEGGNDCRRGGGGDRTVSESMDDGQSDKSGAHDPTQDEFGGTATAAAGSLAMLTIGEIRFEVSRKQPQQALLAAVRELDEHPGCVTYGQAMGGWGKLSLSSTALYLDGLPVPFVSAESVNLDGLFARVAHAGTDATRCHDYTRLSTFSRHHPCARAAAASALAVSPATASSLNFVNTHRGYAGGAKGEEGGSSAKPGPEVMLLLPGRSSGGGSAHTARNHAGFAVQSDGTAGKLYGDLGGMVEGVTLTLGTCLNDAMITVVESVVRLLPSVAEEGAQEPAPTPAEDGAEEPPTSTNSGYVSSSSSQSRLGASSGVEGWETDKEGDTKKDLYDSTSVGKAKSRHGPRRLKRPTKEELERVATDYKEDNNEAGKEGGQSGKINPLPSQPTTATEHVEFWDKLRNLLHGKLSLDADKIEITTLLGRSPAALGASLRLLVSKAKVAYTRGHLDLKLRHALLSTPADPPAEVLKVEDAADDRRGSCSPRHERAKSGGLNPQSRQNSWRHQHHNPPNAPPSPATGLKHESGGSGFPFTASDRQARRTSAAAALPSAAAAVGTAAISTSVPSSPTFSKQQHQQRQQRRHQNHEGQCGGLSGCPTVVPSLSTGAARFGGPLLDVSVEAMGGRESANTSPFGAQREMRGFNDDDAGGKARGLEGRRLLFGARHSIAFVADAMVVIDIAWTVAGKAGPNAHHLEMALASTADQKGNRITSVAEETCRNLNTTATIASSANDTTDLWAPYKATGLKLKVFAEVSPDTGDGSVARRSSAKGQREARESSATTPVPDKKTHLGDGKRTSHLEPLDRGILGALTNGGASARSPRSFPNTKGTRKEREKEADDVVVNGPLRTPRHQRAKSDGPPRRSSGGARSSKTGAAAHGRGSGRVSDKRLTRSRTKIGAPQEREVQGGAINDEAGSGGGRHGGKEPGKLSPTQKLFGAREGSGEAGGIWAGSKVRMVEEGEGGGRVGEEVRGRTGEREGGRKISDSPSPLSIHVEGNDGLVDGPFGIARAPRVAGVGSNGPASCPTRPSGDFGERGEGRGVFSVHHAQGQKPDHIFCQGFWVALRLDLLQWFMPLPTASEATSDYNTSAPFIGEDDEEMAEESTTNRAAAAFATTGTTTNTDSAATPGITEPEHVSILDIITSVHASADIRGFALATWRGVENRDGFVLDIERIDTSARIGRSSGGGETNTCSSIGGGKQTQLRFEAVRLSRLHLDASGGGGGSGGGGDEGESAPPSPTSFGGGRRLSRLWVGSRRQSCRDGRGAPPSPSTDTRDKPVGRQDEEDTDVFASLDRSLSASANKNAILRATEVVFQRKGDTPKTPATGQVAGTADVDVARATEVGYGGVDAGPPPPPPPPPLPSHPSTSAAASASGSFSLTHGEAISIPRENDNDCGSGNGGDDEDRRPQLKAASSLFGNSLSRIRSAAKVTPPPAAQAGAKEEVASSTAAFSTTKSLVQPDAVRSRRGAGFMKKVGLPRRQASCEIPGANSPPRLNIPPPLPPRPALPPRVVTETTTPHGLSPTGGDGDNAVASAPPSPAIRGTNDGTGGAGGKVGATKSIILDGLRLVWTLEIRDSVFLFISDVMESFSPPSPRDVESAAFADDQENPDTTPAPSPGYCSAAPSSRGSSFASRQRRSSFAPSSPNGNNGIDGGVTGRVAPEPRFSELPSSTITGSSTAEPNTSSGLEPESGGGTEGRRRSGGEGGKASPLRRRSATPPPRIDTGGLRNSANSSRSPVGFASPEMSSAGSDMSFMASPVPGGVFTPKGGGRGGEQDDPGCLLHWMAERVQHLEQPGAAEEVASSYDAVSPTASSPGPREWPASTSPSPRPSDNPVSPQGQPGSPRGELRLDGRKRGGGGNVGGGGDGGGWGGRGGGGREGWGGVPGKRHVDYEIHLKNPQIKFFGEGACVILCADRADVEARTYGTWGLVSSSPASPRASVFCSKGFFSSLRRKEVKVKLEKARVFSLPTSEDDLDRWVGRAATAGGEPGMDTTPNAQKRWKSLSLATYPPPSVGRERGPASLSSLPAAATASAWEANSRTGQPASPTRRFFAAPPSLSTAAECDDTSLPAAATASAWEANSRTGQPASPTRRFFAAPPSLSTATECDDTIFSSQAADDIGVGGRGSPRTSVGSAGSGARASLPIDKASEKHISPPSSPPLQPTRAATEPVPAALSASPSSSSKPWSPSRIFSGFGAGGAGGGEGDGRRYGGGGVTDEEAVEDGELREVMRNFSVDALYVFHEAVPVHASQERFRRASKSGRRTGKHVGGDDGNSGAESQRKSGGGDGGGDGVGLRRVHRPPVNRLRLDVPELSSELDSRQFFEVLDVVKNLLLVPPPVELRSKVEERKRQRRAAGCIDSEKVLGQAANLVRGATKGGLNIRDKRRQCRDNLKEVVEETLRAWGSSNGSSSTPQNTGPVPSPSSSGRPSTAAATTSAAAVAAAAAASPPPAAAAALPAATASQDPTTAMAANFSSPVTPPRVRKGAEAKTTAAVAAGVSAADAKPRELTRVEYRIGKCSWRLTMGSKTEKVGQRSDQLEVGFTGLSSTHNYLAQGGVGSGVVVQNVMFQIERLWVRSLAPAAAGGADGGGTSKKGERKHSFSGHQSKPSTPSSSVAASPSSRPSAPSCAAPNVTGGDDGGGMTFDSRAVLSPILLNDEKNPTSRSICTACKQIFTPEDNAWDSCRFHGEIDGEDGVFVLDGTSGGSASATEPATGQAAAGRWSCCGKEDAAATGCAPRPHKPKEIMISVRAEGGPPVLVGNTEVSVFKHLEVNVFPSVLYNLDVNIRRDEAAALTQYFKLEAEADEPRSKGRRLLPSRKISPRAASNISSSRGGGERGDGPPDSPNTARDASGDGADAGAPSLLEHQGSEEGCALLLGRRAAGSAPPNPTGGLPGQPAAVAGLEAGKTQESSEEGFQHDLGTYAVLLKYVRLGAVHLKVSTSGYKIVRLNEFPVVVDSYARHGKMTTWSKIMYQHIWRVVRYTTKSGLKQLKPVGVFGRNPDEEENSQRTLLGEKLPVGKKMGWSSPTGQIRRCSEEINEGRGETQTAKNARASAIGGLNGSSNFGDRDRAGSSSEEGEEEGEDGRGGKAEAAGGFDARLAVRSVRADGKGDGGGKKGGVRAMIQRRLRSRKGSKTEGVSTIAEAEAAVAAPGSLPPTKDGERQSYGVGGGRVDIGVETSAVAEGPEEARSNFSDNRGRDRSSSTSSSSSSSCSSMSSSVFRTPGVAMRTPAGIGINRRASRADAAEDNGRNGAVRGGSTNSAGRAGGGTDHGDENLGQLLGTTRERVVGGDGGGGNASPRYS